MPYFPMFIDLEKKKCLVAGGGAVAYRKVCTLLDFGADVTVVAPAMDERIRALPVTCVPRAFCADDLCGAVLVVAATDNREENRRIAEMARSARILVNAVDQKEDCTFLFPAYVRQQNVVGAFSTAGESPLVAQYLKARAQSYLTERLGRLSAFLGSIRPRVQKRVAQPAKRKAVYQTVLEQLFASGQETLSEDALEEIIERTENGSNEKIAENGSLARDGA